MHHPLVRRLGQVHTRTIKNAWIPFPCLLQAHNHTKSIQISGWIQNLFLFGVRTRFLLQMARMRSNAWIVGTYAASSKRASEIPCRSEKKCSSKTHGHLPLPNVKRHCITHRDLILASWVYKGPLCSTSTTTHRYRNCTCRPSSLRLASDKPTCLTVLLTSRAAARACQCKSMREGLMIMDGL